MTDDQNVDLINRAKTDFLAREKLFHQYRPQIKYIASNICKRPLDWDTDDELSISLIAFNSAIDTYDESKGMKFINYAKMLIHHGLVDYFRKEARFQYASLDTLTEDETVNMFEVKHAYKNYQETKASESQKEMVEDFNQILSKFDITLSDLVDVSPKHIDTRNTLTKIAQTLVADPVLFSSLLQSRRLPIKELILLTGTSRKVIENGRKYIIAVALILGKEEFSGIKHFIRFPKQEGGVGRWQKFKAWYSR
ncbi:RNA polymerase sigma-I factor [Anaerosolibacter sp.]|uniref:RNA polymerase sigma-I factor n=1 Tax=Anaerosolibacter sp. TaxID=1872527 RepID=UPI0039F032AA